MKLATIRTGSTTVAVRVEATDVVELAVTDVGEVLRRSDWRQWAEAAEGPRRPNVDLDFAPLIPRPDKVFCVGMNYRAHVAEMGRELPSHPALFAKFRSALIGANDPIMLPPESQKVDWEAELAIVIGRPTRRVSVADAPDAIAGYTIVNDVSMRDWQNRTVQFLQGKTWERSTPVGPYLVTADEAPGPHRRISCEVDGEVMQDADTIDLVFDPFELVSYISTLITLEPGDLIATGTPSGVGAGRSPQRFLAPGNVVVTAIEGLGECRNVCLAE
ncbi:MAG: Ureidoglycolate lyase [Acidimicrobiia bacterium]|nr:Ureidoglycolate lyase [Acidimicrobiia bacterium]